MQSENRVLSSLRASYSADVRQSSGLTLRTREGDVVNLSFGNRQSLSANVARKESGDGTSVQEFSVAARAASKYSLSVQGDLNNDELAAIDRLAQSVASIAETFFSQGDVDVEGAKQSLLDSMGGVVQELRLELERSVAQTAGAESFSRADAPQVPETPAQPSPQSPPDPSQSAGIRDIGALVNAVADSAFKGEFEQFAESDNIMNSLQDFARFLRESLSRFLSPLEFQHDATRPLKTEVPPQPESAKPSN
ncbi:MAG: hypothetical protein HZA02_03650 [Nitrospinae bacterium]|nr:hypothetical protein [Nitrospinota bacterium]